MLAQQEIYETFCTFCNRAVECNIAVGRYVLIPDHVHLFVALPEEDITLEKWVQALKSVIGKKLLVLGFQKPHWQEGFFDQNESYSEKWEYVRLNPVRAGLSKSPEEWPYRGEITYLPLD